MTILDNVVTPSAEASDSIINDYVPLDTMENAKTGVVSTIIGGVGATVGDFAASTFNSLVPEKYEVDTRDLIGRIGDNALKIYDEHPDAIHLASFIGGVFVPAGLALKGTQALRAGMKGINWFSEAGKVDQIGKINTLIRDGKMATEEYRAATRALAARNLINTAVVDNAAAELAIVTTMNAHPLMEDYVKDPLSNFATSMALGAAIVGPLSHISNRYDIRKLGMAAEQEAVTTLRRGTEPVSLTEDYSMQIAQHQNNIDNWENFVFHAGTTKEYNQLTQDLAASFIRTSKAQQAETFDKMLAAEIRDLPAAKGGDAIRAQLLQSIASDPIAFSGINKIGFATAKEETGLFKTMFGELLGSTAEPTKGIPLTKVKSKFNKITGQVEDKIVTNDMVYSPTFGAFMRRSDLDGYGVASDLIQDERKLTKGMTSNWFTTANRDYGFDKDVQTAAFVDLDYLRKLKAVDEMKEEKLSEIVISPDDGPMLNAVIARMQKMVSEGKDVSALRVVMTNETPNWNKIEEAMVAREIARNTTAGVAGVKPNYLQEMQRSIEGNWDKFDILRSTDRSIKNVVNDWKGAGSGMSRLRKAMDDTFRPSRFTTHGTTEEMKNAVWAIHDSPQSVGLRAELMKHADSEGYVYLYRGMKGKGKSSSTLESFTTNAAKASEFGTPKLYRVRVSDVFGGLRDIPGHAGYEKSTEILVMAHTREGLDQLATAAAKAEIPPSLAKMENYGIDAANFGGKQKTSIKNLIANSYDDFMATAKMVDYTPIAQKTVAAQHAAAGAYVPAEQTVKEVMELAAKLMEDDASKYIGKEVQQYVDDINAYNVAKSANSTKESVEASLTDLHNQLLLNKEKDIKMLADMGFPPEVIRTRTNTPLDTVKAVMAGTGKVEELPNMMYSRADEIGQHISNEKRSLVVGTTMSKIPAAELRSGIQNTMLDQVDALIKRDMLMKSSSTALRELGTFIYSSDNEKRLQMLRDSMNKVVDSALGSKFFQSTDFALRDMGEAGQIITAIGKDSAHLYDKTTKDLVKNVSALFGEVIKDNTAVVEFNIARELNASLKGERYYIDGQFFQKVVRDGKETLEPVLYKEKEFIIQSPKVREAFDEMQKVGRELFGMNTTFRKTMGMPALNDMGFWMPAFNPRDKYITYVIDKVDGSTKLLYGNTPQELKSAESAFAATMNDRTPGSWTFVRKGQDQQMYNKIENRHDPMFMSVADASSLHGGSSALAVVPTGKNIFSELMNGYEHYIHKSVAQNLELHYSDIMQQVDRLSANAQVLTKGQPVGDLQKALHVPTDAGLTVKNTLLGRNNLREYVGWQDAQNGIKTITEMGLQAISKVMEPVINASASMFGKGKTLSDREYEALMKDLADKGIPNPFQGMDDAVARQRFHVEKISQAPNMTARMVAVSNNFAATALLKVMELGQPIVNALSLPILTSAAVQRPMSAEFMGARLQGNGQFSTLASMYDGAKFLFNPEYQTKWRKMGQDLGITTPVLSEVGEFMQMSRSFNPGVMQKAENLMNSRTVEMLSKPAIWSEQAVREMSFATGIQLAKRAYPGLGDAGIMTFARNFVDTAVGNYNPAQRPAVFQGTIGTAMGLFQTYMVTLGQQIYRGFELRDYKALMKMGLAQSSVFGVKSLPGFNQVSEQIGEHFSEDHYDFTTGMYKAVPPGVADIILYGMPSNLGPAVYTRGDIQPRIPNIIGGVQNLAAVQILGQAYDAAKVLGKTTEEIGDEGATQAFMEALSVQSISRPVARISELVTGHSVTRKGNQIAGPEEVWSTQGIMARVFATRGLREAKAREAQYANSMYNAIDVEERNSATHKLKAHIRSGTLTPEIAERLQEKYMRTGSSTGWRSAVNTALKDTDAPGVSAVRNHLTPQSPLNVMIDDI